MATSATRPVGYVVRTDTGRIDSGFSSAQASDATHSVAAAQAGETLELRLTSSYFEYFELRTPPNDASSSSTCKPGRLMDNCWRLIQHPASGRTPAQLPPDRLAVASRNSSGQHSAVVAILLASK
eukprot:scaffold120994_cov27-Prasinocladus_malaysianus.AAC.1